MKIQKIDSWTASEESAFREEYDSYLPNRKTEKEYGFGKFFFEQTHNPGSTYYSVTAETPETAVEQMFYDSLRETQQLESYYDIPIVPVGNVVDTATLPEGVWRVYGIIRYKVWGNNKQPAIEDTKNDLLFLLRP